MISFDEAMGLRLNVGSLIRTVKIEIVNHYVTTKHTLTWQAHQKQYLRIRIHSSHLVPFLSVLGRRCDLHHGMKKMRLEKVSSPHEWSKLFINSWFAFSTILLAFFKVMNLWNAKNFIYIIKSRGHKDP